MSGRGDSGRQPTAGPASIFGDASTAPVWTSGGDSSDALVPASLDELRADAYNTRRERDLLATKVALLAYKLQMNSQQRHRHHHHQQQQQLCQSGFCGRLVFVSTYLSRVFLACYLRKEVLRSVVFVG